MLTGGPPTEPERCLLVFGAPVQVEGPRDKQLQTIVGTAWPVAHALWAVPGHEHARLRLLHSGVCPAFVCMRVARPRDIAVAHEWATCARKPGEEWAT